MSVPSPHRLVLASAGTGKTWQLTGFFLRLLLRGVAPESVLATTFTRKAAGEILDRVLRRLVDAVGGRPAREELGVEVGEELSEARVRELLVSLTRRLDRFRVRTLDAFFVQLAHLFALDLGLPPDWGIVEEAADDALRREALARALERAEPLELLEILRGLQQAGAARSVERLLLERAAEGRDAFLDSAPDAWGRIHPPPGPTAEELAEARDVLAQVEPPHYRNGNPNRNWKQSLDDALAGLDHGRWRDFAGKGLGAKVSAAETSYDHQPISAELAAAIRTCLRQAAHVLVGEVALENRAAQRWLARFEAAYEELKGEERAYRFEDLPKALHPRDENRIAEREVVWYRLDGRIDHLLLDEFQDTAPVQWRILQHLAGEILADGTGQRSFFCVGDVKQSIYGWREAEPRLLASLPERYSVLVPERLKRSFRSSRIVLDTVERVFGRIGENPALADEPARQRAARSWQADFDRLDPQDLPGAAFLVESPARTEASVLELAAERAAGIRAEAPLATLGLLLRRNLHIGRLILLLSRHGIRASGEGGNPLVDSAAVQHLLSLLHLADHPGDTAAAFHVAHSPLAAAAGLTPAGFRGEAQEAAARVRRRLAAEGYGAFAASFLEAVARGYSDWDERRFAQLVDLGYAFDARAGLRTTPFVEHVRATPVEDPSATQVRVMTIHSAKGLEFDAVILPELDLPFSLRETPLLTSRPDPAALLAAVSHSRGRAVCQLDPAPGGLAALWSEREERETREALCLLYVGMTRAKHRLDLLVQPASKSSSGGRVSHTFAGLLRGALALGAGRGEPELWAHPENERPWFPRRGPTAPAARPVARSAARGSGIAFRPEPAAGALSSRAPSAEEGQGRLFPRDLLRPSNAAARVRGRLIHRWLQEVLWLEDFVLGDAALLELGRSETGDEALLRRVLREFRGQLDRPRTRAVLARPRLAPDEEAEVWRERRFAVLLPGEGGAEELWSGAFDRVVLRRRGREVSAAELVDFKTDELRADELDERAGFYRPQLVVYRRVLARMSGLPEERIATRLFFLSLDAPLEVAPEGAEAR